MKNVVGVQKKILDSKNYVDLQNKLGFANQHDFLCFLFNYIQNVVRIKEKDKLYGLSKITDYIDALVLDNNSKDNFEIIEKARETRIQVVKRIKNTSKKERKHNEIIKLLRDVANDLEALEVEIRYNINSEFVKTNSDIIKYILFKERNIEISEDLIENHPYLINLCNTENENILDLLVDKCLRALSFYVCLGGNRRNVQYYDEILALILKKRKIDIDSRIIERNILKIKKWKEANFINNEMVEWLDHLFKRLDDPIHYFPNKEVYDLMYGIEDKNEEQLLLNACHIQIDKENRIGNNQILITIDDKDVSARDDAFSVEKKENGNYGISVYFADVNYFCDAYPELRDIAYRRMRTLYLPDGVINMIPHEFTKRLLSLDERKPRFARSLYLEIDKYGNEVEFTIKKSSIIVNNNFSFQEATNIIKHNSKNKLIDEIFENLLIVEPLLRKMIFHKNCSSPQQSEEIIETLMLYPSFKIASYFKKNDYPFLYKSHVLGNTMPTPLQQRLDNLNKSTHGKYIDIIEDNQSMDSHSYFSVTPIGHEGLKVPCYSRYTSPIREYAGIVVNDCIDNFYFNPVLDYKKVEMIREDLEKTADYLNSREEELRSYAKGYSRFRKK